MIKLLRFAKKYRIESILAPIFIVCEVITEVLIPKVMGKIIDIAIPSGDLILVVKYGGMMVVLAMAALFFGAASAYFASKAGTGFAAELRIAEFNKIQEFSAKNIDKFSTPSLITRLTTDVTNTQNAFLTLIRILLRAPTMMIASIIMMSTIKLDFLYIVSVSLPVLLICLVILMVLGFPLFKIMLKKYDKMSASVQENLIAIRVVKAFVRSDYEKEKYRKANTELRDTSMKAEKIIIMGFPILNFLIYGTIIAVLWIGGNMIADGNLLSGELSNAITYVTQILFSLMMITFSLISLVVSRASISRINEVLDEKIDIVGADSDQEVNDGSIEFDHVNFSYSNDMDKLVLKDINLKIKPGEKIGIIGGTGASKTTLISLIPRLYDTTSGSVRVGGADVKEYSLEKLRSGVSMVPQKNLLFTGTIKENLKWGDQNATDEEIVSACKAAQAHDFIMSFPKGYETEMSQGGTNVSGGQKQRLCIARALLKKPKIVILDDSTSAVDTATDAKIQEAFKSELKDMTILIIAQRISSVCNADRIIIMDQGEIKAIGTHEELLKDNKIYQEIYTSQQKGAE